MPNPRNQSELPYGSYVNTTEFYTILANGIVYRLTMENTSQFILNQGDLGVFSGTLLTDNTNPKAAFQQLADAIETLIVGAGFSTYYDADSATWITGSPGITATKGSGIITITVGAGKVFGGATVDVGAGDALYSSPSASQAVKVIVDNSANGVIPSFHPQFFGRSAAGAPSSSNPMKPNLAIDIEKQIEVLAGGILAVVFPYIPTNAADGGIIVI